MTRHTILHTSLIVVVALGVVLLALLPITLSTLVLPTKVDSRSQLPIATTVTTTPIATTTISFTGDVMLGRHVEYLANTFGIDYPIRGIRDLFASSTYVVINFESAMAYPHQKTPNGGMRFSTHESLIQPLLELGVTHASLANNHSFDYGESGYRGAKETLSGFGIVPFGNARTVSTSSLARIVTPAAPVTLVGIHTLFFEPSAAELKDVLGSVSADELLVVYVHWGDEYVLVPNERQRQFAKTLIALGADVIIGHHPHVVQSVEIIDGVPVLYSLGNFIFDQYFSTAVQTGLVVDLVLSADTRELRLRAVTRQDRAQPRPMSNEESDTFFMSLAGRSDPVLGDQIRAKTISF